MEEIDMKNVYFFSKEESEGNRDMKQILGGKGANLAEMASIGIPVPPGFTITTEVCKYYYDNKKTYPNGLMDEVKKNIQKIEKATGKKLGDKTNPLLVSCRSGAAVSMPGMMDTVLNIGLNDETVLGLSKSAGERFAYDSYRRLLQMFGDVVMELEHHDFEQILSKAKADKKVKLDVELDAEDLKKVVKAYKDVYKKAKKEFPQNPEEQVKLATGAVFGSWMNDRAIAYRKLNSIKGLIGTAVTIQAMVFGNMGDDCGTGVAFTRDPSTGEKKFFGELLYNAQGEDVVAGIRTPVHLDDLKKRMPKMYNELNAIKDKLEAHYKDMQDIEFTIEKNKLYMLQTRNGKRTAMAAIRTAVEMVAEKLIDEKTAVRRVEPSQLDQLLHKTIDLKAKATVLAKGLPASPGAAVGTIVFTAEEAEKQAEAGKKVILVRAETSPEDIKGMATSQGILTSTGGMTSHAAVVARGMGKCCVAGCSDVVIKGKTMTVKGKTFKEGDTITLNGTTGEVLEGAVPLVEPVLDDNFRKLMSWADKIRRLKVRTNADIPRDAIKAMEFGAEGIGLCRTEHMFFEGERIKPMREMIVADTEEARRKALDKLLPFQKSDFKGLFETMNGLPVTIRLLDPPLHEFLPKEEKDIKELAKELKISVEKLKEKIEFLHEQNPMLGHRGCRLGITFPEITEMQVRAIFEAACELAKAKKKVEPEVMVPIVGNVSELKHQKEIIIRVAEETMKKAGVKLDYKIGTMIEVPRAAVTADKIAEEAEFFSFGTNDLTQMTLGFSRDDVGKFLPDYIKKNILEKDPFQTLDQDGVGQLVKMAVEKGRSVKPKLKIGICGEHGGDPESIYFCHKLGLDYVSCSPFRVPIARLAAAHAVLREEK
jgi:pyruvate,orthophosphate dikinase